MVVQGYYHEAQAQEERQTRRGVDRQVLNSPESEGV